MYLSERKVFSVSIILVVCGLCFANVVPNFGNRDPECPENLVYQYCGSSCNRTCETQGKGTCNRKCVERCGCPPNMPILHNGRCIKESECAEVNKKPAPAKPHGIPNIPHSMECPDTQEFQVCGSYCNMTCKDGNTPPACRRICVARCGCPKERPIWHNEKCISYDQCDDDGRRSGVIGGGPPEDEDEETTTKNSMQDDEEGDEKLDESARKFKVESISALASYLISLFSSLF